MEQRTSKLENKEYSRANTPLNFIKMKHMVHGHHDETTLSVYIDIIVIINQLPIATLGTLLLLFVAMIQCLHMFHCKLSFLHIIRYTVTYSSW